MNEENRERFLDKTCAPSPQEIAKRLGKDAMRRLDLLDAYLKSHYTIERELKFPFGNQYGWGYKYTSGGKMLCYVFFERDAFTVTITIGKAEVAKLMKKLPEMLPKTADLWRNRYPCGDGGWVHYPVDSDGELRDIETLIAIKKKPLAKQAV